MEFGAEIQLVLLPRPHICSLCDLMPFTLPSPCEGLSFSVEFIGDVACAPIAPYFATASHDRTARFECCVFV